MNLTLENLIDLRRLLANHVIELKRISDNRGHLSATRTEAVRQAVSLSHVASEVEQCIKDEKFEQERLPY